MQGRYSMARLAGSWCWTGLYMIASKVRQPQQTLYRHRAYETGTDVRLMRFAHEAEVRRIIPLSYESPREGSSRSQVIREVF